VSNNLKYLQLCKYAIVSLTAALVVLISCVCYGENLFVAWPGADEKNLFLLQTASNVAGINVKYVKKSEILQREHDEAFTPCVISAEYLNNWTAEEQEKLVKTVSQGKLELMVVFSNESMYDFLNCKIVTTRLSSEKNEQLTFSASHKDTLKELSGTRIPIETNPENLFMKVSKKSLSSNHIESLIWFNTLSGIQKHVMMIKKIRGGGIHFAIVNRYDFADKNYKKVPSLVPFIIFLKKAYGKKCWHNNTVQANLTLDDPWLVEPYGNLSYVSLLNEMETANFHTSIAFIPWNYDRSKQEVVDLFLKHPGRYSIVVHGNNHDHYEFREEVPLQEQEDDIRQAISRMKAFNRLTYIPYEMIMVFPHGISPKKTISILKKFNFIASVNAQTTPLGCPESGDVLDVLTPAILKYYSFPLLKRHPPDIHKSIIDLNLFLEKPLLFYTHQDYFSLGIHAFNGVAEYVNRKSLRGVEWTSLGEIAENLYQIKLIEDRTYKVRMMTRKITLHNDTKLKNTYFIESICTGSANISKVVLGDVIYEDGIDSLLRRPIVLAPGQKVKIEILYENDINFKNVSIKKSNFKVKLLRLLSDFRDMVLSRSKLGRKIIDLYYAGENRY